MLFSKESDVSIMITSCGRFDLLKRTLESLDQYNTYPIRHVYITEDSGKQDVFACLPEGWHEHTKVYVNDPKLGQLASIDLAYSDIDTEWVFHCEDDWEFYRPGFIEDSMTLLIEDPQALQVWLRSSAHDLSIHSPYVYLGDRKNIKDIFFYKVNSEKADWQGFSFNPGLRRLADYKKHAPYSQYSGEKDLSRLYAAENRYALILENDAVLHTGFGAHVVVNAEKERKKKRKKREKLKNALFLVIGIVLGLILGVF